MSALRRLLRRIWPWSTPVPPVEVLHDLPLSPRERHELEWTFRSIVDPRKVPE